MAEHVIAQGECLSSIAKTCGFDWQTIWKDPRNADLRAKRSNPNVLEPGDVVYIPEKQQGVHSGSSDARHNYELKRTSTKLILRLLRNGEARANESYVLNLKDVILSGTTNSQGRIEEVIPADATEATLTLSGGLEEYSLKLGNLDPIDCTTGVQARLRNLGYYNGPVDDCDSPEIHGALRAFQRANGLQDTGVLDGPTERTLKSAHGS